MSNQTNIPIGLTYDDILLVPKRSKIAHRHDVSTRTKLTGNITLEIPFISANMDTVTESRMAISLAHRGGIGIIHRFMSMEKQAAEVKKVKRHEGFILYKPFTLFPWSTVAEAKLTAEETKVSSFIITDEKDRVKGILTRRDLIFAENSAGPVSEIMTPEDKLITAPQNITYKKAKEILRKHKIEKLPLVDRDNKLIGLITAKSIEHQTIYKSATTDKYGRLRVGAAVGAVGDFMDRAKALIEAGVDVIVVDVAHGHNEISLKAVKKVRQKFKDIDLIGGNLATAEAAIDLIKIGVDALKVGIGPGGLCTTRIVTGVGVPQFTAVAECSQAAKKYGVTVIADGGTNYPGDITKALAAGAGACMLAGWFAGTDESPGAIIMKDGMKFKAHRGAASFLAVADRKFASEEISSVDRLNTVVAEGVEALIPYKGKVADIIYQLIGALRSGMSYCNASTIAELQKNAEFIRVTEAGLRESKSHNVRLI